MRENTLGGGADEHDDQRGLRRHRATLPARRSRDTDAGAGRDRATDGPLGCAFLDVGAPRPGRSHRSSSRARGIVNGVGGRQLVSPEAGRYAGDRALRILRFILILRRGGYAG